MRSRRRATATASQPTTQAQAPCPRGQKGRLPVRSVEAAGGPPPCLRWTDLECATFPEGWGHGRQ
eukprot:4362690-Pyramimonas_sp.AAC.1